MRQDLGSLPVVLKKERVKKQLWRPCYLLRNTSLASIGFQRTSGRKHSPWPAPQRAAEGSSVLTAFEFLGRQFRISKNHGIRYENSFNCKSLNAVNAAVFLQPFPRCCRPFFDGSGFRPAIFFRKPKPNE